MIYIFIGLCIVFVVAIIFGVKCHKGADVLKRKFSKCNVIVFGKKGTGKDLLFNKVINLRKKPCYCNIPYNPKYSTVASIKQFSCSPNVYRNFINGDITTIDKICNEGKDFYISDGGIMLPSQYHPLLDKLYPSLPVYYALSRQLANSNIHINTQNLIRVWDKLREQADCYIRVERTVNLCGFLFTTFVVYDFYESAKMGLQPYPHSIFSGAFNTANYNEFCAKYGTISRHIICQSKKSVKFDTRHFHKVLYGYKAK